MSKETITSIKITGNVKRKNYVEFILTITTSTSSYTVERRYSEFKRLYEQLAQQFSSPPPGSFPVPTRSVFSVSLFKSELTPPQLLLRQQALEQWLRAILSSRDTRYSTSRVFLDFLASTSSTVQSTGFTSSSWLASHSSLLPLCQSTKATFVERDTLIAQGDASSHAVNQRGKQELLKLIVQLELLTKGLKTLAQSGMVEGELQRRRAMLERLEDEVAVLGKMSTTIPRLAATSSSSMRGAKESESVSSTADRTALFSTSNRPGRVLGTAVAVETAQTRPLDNQSLLQLQQTYVDQQDSKLDTLTSVLRRQREMGMMIGRELEEQSELIDGIDRDIDRVKNRVGTAQKQVKRLGK